MSQAGVSSYLPWRIEGTYLESCNCEAICPCRMIGGAPGGRSTYGVCMGALSWHVEDGQAGETDLSGLAAVLVVSYADDEPRSPWTISRPVETDQTVSCVIPGHDHPGTEHHAEVLRVADPVFEAVFEGNCAFSTTFRDSSDI